MKFETVVVVAVGAEVVAEEVVTPTFVVVTNVVADVVAGLNVNLFHRRKKYGIMRREKTYQSRVHIESRTDLTLNSKIRKHTL